MRARTSPRSFSPWSERSSDSARRDDELTCSAHVTAAHDDDGMIDVTDPLCIDDAANERS